MITRDHAARDTCGCCEPVSSVTPESIDNRPGLSSVRYRVGAYSSFRRSMLEAITTQRLRVDDKEYRPLVDWTARDSEDYGIACLNLWAYLGDILTFYQERIANEAYLGTAELRESLVHLAGMLSYRPTPGRAASADLAFLLEKGADLKIPEGLKVQSVPAPKEKPQKYETLADLDAYSALNKVRIFPEPMVREPLQSGSTWGILDPSPEKPLAKPLVPGNQMLIFDDSVACAAKIDLEEKRIETVEQVDWYSRVTWAPAVSASLPQGQAFRWTDKFLLFGHNAPERQLISEPDPTSDLALIWAELETDFEISKGKILYLDGVYDELKVGTRVLVLGSGKQQDGSECQFLRAGILVQVRQAPAELRTVVGGPSNKTYAVAGDTVTEITLDGDLPVDIADRRTVTVYLLETQGIAFWRAAYHPTDPAEGIVKKEDDCFHAPLDQLTTLEKGRVLILDDVMQKPEVVRVTKLETLLDPGSRGVDHLKVGFTPSLTRDLDGSTAFFLGNIARATHGETVAEEILGDGDATKVFQRFTLKRSPVTYEPSSQAAGGSNSLKVRVDDVHWNEVASLHGQDGEARVYITRTDEAGKMTLTFGDGLTGARLPSGRKNIVARYRQGIGTVGEVAAASLTNLMDRPKGLKDVVNPRSAFGAADAEHAACIRKSAPDKVRIFDRIVSLRDFEDAARAYSGVAKASAVQFRKEEPTVVLTVAGDGGKVLDSRSLAALGDYLNERRDPNRVLEISGKYQPVPIYVEAVLYLQSGHEGDQVKIQAEAALKEHFAFANRELGEPVRLSSVYEVLQAVRGVVGAKIVKLTRKTQYTLSHVGPLWGTAFWWSGRPGMPSEGSKAATSDGSAQARVPILPFEIAVIKTPATDLALTMRPAP